MSDRDPFCCAEASGGGRSRWQARARGRAGGGSGTGAAAARPQGQSSRSHRPNAAGGTAGASGTAGSSGRPEPDEGPQSVSSQSPASTSTLSGLPQRSGTSHSAQCRRAETDRPGPHCQQGSMGELVSAGCRTVRRTCGGWSQSFCVAPRAEPGQASRIASTTSLGKDRATATWRAVSPRQSSPPRNIFALATSGDMASRAETTPREERLAGQSSGQSQRNFCRSSCESVTPAAQESRGSRISGQEEGTVPR